jgi:hypothetical protein
MSLLSNRIVKTDQEWETTAFERLVGLRKYSGRIRSAMAAGNAATQ